MTKPSVFIIDQADRLNASVQKMVARLSLDESVAPTGDIRLHLRLSHAALQAAAMTESITGQPISDEQIMDTVITEVDKAIAFFDAQLA